MSEKKKSTKKKDSSLGPTNFKKLKQVPIDGANKTELDRIPEKLKLYVSQEIWASWSPIRRESFTQIIKNPNTFFYRNRPPGDPQKYGPFSAEEEQQFIDRLSYFRNTLNVSDGLWGLFSVPIRGRLGYQCSNFYRLLVKDGKIKDDKYSIDADGKLRFSHGGGRSSSKDAQKILEKEAFDFIEQCMKTEDGEVPQVSVPIRVNAPTQRKPASSPSQPQKKQVHYVLGVFNGFGRPSTIPERSFTIMDQMRFATTGSKKGGIQAHRPSISDVAKSPLYGAPDPITNEPMSHPMMDPSGYVMDSDSWMDYFEKPGAIGSMNALIDITGSNFDDVKMQITNIPV